MTPNGSRSLETPFRPRCRIRNYELVIERVIRGDGSISPGSSVTLRRLGDADHVGRYPALRQMPQVGDHHLYGLSRNPDGTFGTSGWWGEFAVDGPKITHADDLGMRVLFAESQDLEGFIQEIEAAEARRQR